MIRFLGQNLEVGVAVVDTIQLQTGQVYQTTPTYFDPIQYMIDNGGIDHTDQKYLFYNYDYDDEPFFGFIRTFIDDDHFVIGYRFRRGTEINPHWGDDSTGWWYCPRLQDIHGYTYPGVTYGNIKAEDHWRNGIYFFRADISSGWHSGALNWQEPFGAAVGHYSHPFISPPQGVYTGEPEPGAFQEIESGDYAGAYEPVPGTPAYVIYENGSFVSDGLMSPFVTFALGGLAEEIEDFEEDTAEPGGGGSYGGYGFRSSPIGFPGLPSISILDTGMATMFHANTAQSRAFANFLWSDDFFDNIIKLIADPIENVICFASVPMDVSPYDGNPTTVSVGNVATDAIMPLLTRQYVTADFGELAIPHNWYTALDYEPGTQIELFLPFVGLFNLSASEVRGGRIAVRYNIDLLSGDFVAFVRVTNSEHNNLNSVLYHKTGNLLTNFPMTEANYANFYKSIITGAAGAVTGAVTGNPLIAANSMVNAAMSIGSVQLERTGSFSGVASAMSCRQAYIVLTQPKQHLPASYSKFVGYPSYLPYKLSTLSGFTKVNAVIDNTVSATDAEKAEIEKLLKEGVLL